MSNDIPVNSPTLQYRLDEIYSAPFRIDEVSSTLYYIGWIDDPSLNVDETLPIWRIKRIQQTGTVWSMGYPNGDTSFSYVWGDRDLLTYN